MRMTNGEAIMWAVEKDPALRSDFCNLTFLDRRPRDERLRETVQRALDAIPRLGQRVVGAPLRIVPPEFADDPTLDLEAHVRVLAVPPPGDDRALLDLCGALAEQPLDRARPLWEFTVIDGLSGGRSAILQKIHHTITDGVGGLKLSVAMVDFERDPDRKAPDEVPPRTLTPATPLSTARGALVDATQRSIDAIRRTIEMAGHAVVHPGAVPAMATDAARLLHSLQRQALVTDAARSDLMNERSLRRHFEILGVPFEPLHSAATKLGGSINDAFVTGIAERAGPIPRAVGQCRRRATAGDADQHTSARRSRRRTRSYRRASSFPSSPRTTSARCSATCTNGWSSPSARPRSARPKDSPGSSRACRPRCSSRWRGRRRARSTSASRICAEARCRSTSRARAFSAAIRSGPRTGCALSRHDVVVLRRGTRRPEPRPGRDHRRRRVHA